MIYKYLWDAFDIKSHARELAILYRAAESLTLKLEGKNIYQYVTERSKIIEVLEVLHKKYWDRFHRVYGQRAKDRGGWPHMMKTVALKELLGTGFMHLDDLPFRIDKTRYYYVYGHVGDLWYPYQFDSHQHAIEVQRKYGVMGFTGTTLIKTK
jgi:hypothetical protein